MIERIVGKSAHWGNVPYSVELLPPVRHSAHFTEDAEIVLRGDIPPVEIHMTVRTARQFLAAFERALTDRGGPK